VIAIRRFRNVSFAVSALVPTATTRSTRMATASAHGRVASHVKTFAPVRISDAGASVVLLGAYRVHSRKQQDEGDAEGSERPGDLR
jgi:hypothetical protein